MARECDEEYAKVKAGRWPKRKGRMMRKTVWDVASMEGRRGS